MSNLRPSPDQRDADSPGDPSGSLPCPLCGGGGRFLYHAYDQLHGLPGEFSVRLCRACGVLYLTPALTPAALAEYYPREYITHQAPLEIRSRLGRRIEQWLQPLPTPAPPGPAARALDIGCGAGGYLTRLARAGWDTYGVESDPQAVAVARAAGHALYEGLFEEVDLPSDHFDLVALEHVLEHLPDPAAALRKVVRLLRPGGMALIRTPVHDALTARLFRADWFPLEAPRHRVIFSSVALRRACTAAGLQVISAHREQDPRYLLSSVRRSWLSAVGGRRPRQVECAATRHILLGLPAARLLQWLGQGDQITLTCRK